MIKNFDPWAVAGSAILFLAGFADYASAATGVYTGPDEGDYNTATNWDPATIPNNDLGGTFDVTISGDAGPVIASPVTINKLTVPTAALSLTNSTLTVNGLASVGKFQATATAADATATFTTGSRGDLTLKASAGRTVTVKYGGAFFISNTAPLRLQGPGTIRITDLAGADLLAELEFNPSVLEISSGHVFRRVNTAGVFDPALPLSNSGRILVAANGPGEASRFAAGYVSTLGQVDLLAPLIGTSAIMEVIGGNFTTTTRDLSLRGDGAALVDENGLNALRGLTSVGLGRALTVGSGKNLTVSGPFTNNGKLVVVQDIGGNTSFTINGVLAGLAADGTFTERGNSLGSTYEIRTGVGTGGTQATATLRATGADIVHLGIDNASRPFTGNELYFPLTITLAGPGARFVDELDRDALRNLASIDFRGVLQIADGLDYTLSPGKPFANSGTLLVSAAEKTNTVLTIGGTLANLTAGGATLGLVGTGIIAKFDVRAAADSTATLRIPTANITSNAGSIVLSGAGSRIEDTAGNDALRNLAQNSDPAGVPDFGGGDITIENGRTFTTAGNFSNRGRNRAIEVASTDGRDAAFVVNGTLAQQSGGTLLGFYSPGAAQNNGDYTVFARGTGSATFQFNGANVLTNEAFLELTSPNSRFLDQTGQDGLRNLAGNRGVLFLREGRALTAAGNFTNEGQISMRNRNLARLPMEATALAAIPHQDTTFTVQGNLTNAGLRPGANPNAPQIGDEGMIDIVGEGDAIGRVVIQGAFSNQGVLLLSGQDSGTAAAIVTGSFTNFDAATRTLTGGTLVFERRDDLPAAQAYLQFPAADIVTNAADLSFSRLTTPATDAGNFIRNPSGQSGLRNLAVNAATGSLDLERASLSPSGSFANAGLLLLQASATLTLPAGSTATPTTFANTGVLALTVDSSRLNTDVFTQSSGFAQINGRLTATTRFEQTGGQVNLLPTSRLTAATVQLAGGTIRGRGIVTGSVFNDQILAPATFSLDFSDPAAVTTTNEQGTLAITGGLTLGSNSVLDLTVASPANTDRLTVTGAVAVGGELRVTLTGGYVPGSGDTITLLTAGSPITGAFANVASGGRLTTVDGRGAFVVNYAGQNAVTLGVFVADPNFTPTPTPTPTVTPTPAPTATPNPGGGPGGNPDAASASVSIALKGKREIKTFKSLARIKGTAFSEAGVTRVLYKFGKRKSFRPARGTVRWKIKTRLKTGTNKFKVLAVGANGQVSPILQVKVRRLERD